MPETWHLSWTFSPGGSRYFVDGPIRNTREPDIWDVVSNDERNALAFDDEKVAQGYALALNHFYDVNLVPVQRWIGLPAATNWVNQ